MPSYSAPPPFPWIARPESAFRPARAWLPYDSGPAFREVIRGDHAAIAGTAAWGYGPYGRCFSGNGSSYATSGTFASMDSLSVTVAHLSGASTFRGLLGWGTGQQGLLYTGSRLDLVDSVTATRFSANLATPTTAWRIITLTLAGHASGSTASIWVDGALASSGALGAALAPATQLRIGALFGAGNPWQAGIGPAYLHDRALAGEEIRRLHADIWRVLRDFRWETARRVAAVPPPALLAGVGQVAPATAAGSIQYLRELGGTGIIAPASAAGTLQYVRELAGVGVIAPATASGFIGPVHQLAGVGIIAPATAVGIIRPVPVEALAAVVAYAMETPELAGSVGAIRWERAPEKAPAPYATIREIATRWRAHSELGGIEEVLLELKLTHTSAELAKSLARQWTRGPAGLDRAAIPFGDGKLLALQRETAPQALPPSSSTDAAGNQLRAVVVQYRAIIERY